MNIDSLTSNRIEDPSSSLFLPVNVIWKSNHIHSIWKIESNQNAKRIEFDLAFKNNIFKNEIKSIKIQNFKIKSKLKKT